MSKRKDTEPMTKNIWKIEEVNPGQRGLFKHAVFDFDGTISLIREGWQGIMIPYFTDELMETPEGSKRDRQEIYDIVRDFVYVNTGKQTIYQCIAMAEQVVAMGGQALTPQEYKDEYHRRLNIHIENRVQGLKNGTENPAGHIVPGAFDILERLHKQGICMYLASGTDEEYVKEEAALLGVDKYFGQHIYGAQKDYKSFSKKMVIDRIIRTNDLHGDQLMGFGDGYVEIENIREAGGFACGVATDEIHRVGLDEWKRQRLIGVGANIIIPDFTQADALMQYLFDGGNADAV